MFVRCKKRFKDGKEHRYWSVVENVRVSGGRVVQRQVLYLGEINDSQRAAWCRSIEVVEGAQRSKQVALFPSDREAPELDCEVVQVRLAELTLHAPRQWGACWLALTLWERLELDRFWGPRLPASREGTRWLDILKVQVCYRLIDPGSDWRLHRHWYEHSALRDLLGCDRVIASNTLYRCLDKLAAHKQEFFSFLRARWTTMFNARFDILLYDLTSTFFESDPPFEDKRQFGHSRDQRRDCVQVVIALVVTPDGFPLAYEVMPGNTADNTTLADFLTKIEDQYGRSDRVWIMDRGIPTEQTLETMRTGRCTGALSGRDAQGPADPAREVIPRSPLARSAPIGRCQAPDQRRGALRAGAKRQGGRNYGSVWASFADNRTVATSSCSSSVRRRKTPVGLGTWSKSKSHIPTKSSPPTASPTTCVARSYVRCFAVRAATCCART